MVYYYRIYHPRELGRNSWRYTHAPLMRSALKKLPNWRQSGTNRKNQNQNQIQYSNNDTISNIKNRFETSQNIASKIFLARMLRGLPFHPPTLIIKNGKVSDLNQPHLRRMYQSNQAGKWYLKPDIGHASHGIKILSRPQHALQYRNQSDYVLQKAIEPMELYHGRKFEYRIWVLFVYQKGQLKTYYYNDAVMRISAVQYQPRSMQTRVNITTSSHHYKTRNVYKSDLLSNQPYFQPVFDKSIQICNRVLRALLKYIRPPNPRHSSRGFDVMGFDFILKKPNASSSNPSSSSSPNSNSPQPPNPIMIEINRNIGYYTYPPKVHSPAVMRTNHRMMMELVKVAIEAVLQRRWASPALLESTGWRETMNFNN